MALTAYLMSADAERRQIGIRQALGINLCRCTGYAAILRAARQLLETKSIFSVVREDDSVVAHKPPPYDGKDELN